MNIRVRIAQIADEMDSMGMYNEADALDGVLRGLPEEIDSKVTPEMIMQMPHAEEIIKEARGWAADCNWMDQDELEYLDDYQILKGVQRHYEGGLAEFLRNSIPGII